MEQQINLIEKVEVKLTKIDDKGNKTVETATITREELEKIWQSQMQPLQQ